MVRPLPSVKDSRAEKFLGALRGGSFGLTASSVRFRAGQLHRQMTALMVGSGRPICVLLNGYAVAISNPPRMQSAPMTIERF